MLKIKSSIHNHCTFCDGTNTAEDMILSAIKAGFTDFGMCVYFKGPKSFTGEDIVEFHSHGGLAITKGILKKILSLGVRLATNGEFTKRAFMNGKLSLFTKNDAAGRVYEFLAKNCDENGNVSYSGSMALLARNLSLGRTSLYRALDTLEHQNLIVREDGKIKVLL